MDIARSRRRAQEMLDGIGIFSLADIIPQPGAVVTDELDVAVIVLLIVALTDIMQKH